MIAPIERPCPDCGTPTTARHVCWGCQRDREATGRWCDEHGPTEFVGCDICKDAILEDEADAELQARIDSDPDVAGACCPACEDHPAGGGSPQCQLIKK